ncbi:putative metallo-dependent phosphatase [Lupinus albus]|uniref:Putative metallo-dependent phosphatase n=1 Tax=Lupinus albus TaxID=3870 RepID=A0A6A4NFV5_LUPAL|nr:putative metallo-dependent phosphatase [Lupinus albus]
MVVRFNPCFLTLSQQPHHSAIYFSKKVTLRCSYGMRHMKRGSDLRRPKVIPSVLGNNDGLRVFVVSDLHTDYAENLNWVKCLSTAKVKHKNDVLLVAGDVAETYDMFLVTMSLFKERFEHVFYIPGNHDLWCRREGQKYVDSLEKLNELLDACKRLGVETNPMVVDNIGIIPLFSWYHESFDKEKDITDFRIPSLEMACKDFYACKWPEGLSNGDMSLALHFDAINDKQMKVIKEIQKTCHHIITFSHFVPRQELCPEKRMLFYPKLPKIIGSDSLEDRIRSIHGAEGRRDATSCHVFGHTHFCWDAVVDGIRYLQAPLAYPRERRRRMNGGENWLPFCLYGENKFADRIKPCFWSDYYSANTRTPHNTELAPWVSRFYKKTESIDL